MESRSGVSAIVGGSIFFRRLYFAIRFSISVRKDCNISNSDFSAAILHRSENKKHCVMHFRRSSVTDNPDNPDVLFYKEDRLVKTLQYQ